MMDRDLRIDTNVGCGIDREVAVCALMYVLFCMCACVCECMCGLKNSIHVRI